MTTLAWAQNAASPAPYSDLTSVIAGIGTGGFTIWFCLKWVQSELARSEDKIESMKKECAAEREQDKIEFLAKMEESERRWRHDYNNAQGLYAAEKDLRLLEAKDFNDRIRELYQANQSNNQIVMESIKVLAKLEEKIDGCNS